MLLLAKDAASCCGLWCGALGYRFLSEVGLRIASGFWGSGCKLSYSMGRAVFS